MCIPAVLALEESFAPLNEFLDKVPPCLDGRTDYAPCKEYLRFMGQPYWSRPRKTRPALVGRLSHESKASAKPISVSKICAADGADILIELLDKSFANDAENQLETYLATFLDYTWKNHLFLTV